MLEFCATNLPDTSAGLERQGARSDADSPEFYRRLGRAGWIGRHWPVQYGGCGGSNLQTAIIDEALGYARAPLSAYLLSVKVFGNSLLAFGSEQQKEIYLPRIAAGEAMFCQGYSEPNAGSDFASIQTTAQLDGEEFVINGQKLWTSSAEVAHYMYLAARTRNTQPGHRGISLFILDMNSPGIMVRTFPTLGGGVHNQVTLDNVRLPKDNLVGELHRGFYHAMKSLDLERACLDRVGAAQYYLDALQQYVRQRRAPHGRGSLADISSVRHQIAQLYMRCKVARCFGYSVVREQDVGSATSTHFSHGKLYIGLLTQAIATAMFDILGPEAQFEFGSRVAPLDGLPAAVYRASPGLTLAGGATEIQRTVIAVRGLGLPK